MMFPTHYCAGLASILFLELPLELFLAVGRFALLLFFRMTALQAALRAAATFWKRHASRV